MKKFVLVMSSLGLTSLLSTTVFANTVSSTAPSSQSVSNAISGAVSWMNKSGMSSIHDWAILADYAGTGAFQKSQWSQTEISKLKVTTDYARFVLALLAAGLDPHSYQGQNFVKKLADAQLTSGSDAGKFADNPDLTGDDLINVQSWSMIALIDAGGASFNETAAVAWLKAHQNADGGFGYSKTYSSSDPDDTASAIVALTLSGASASDPVIQKALDYLKTQQATDGGFGSGGATNSDSTGVVMDALAAEGISSNSWAVEAGTPIKALLSLVDKKSGGFNYDNSGQSWSGVSGLSTRDGLIGLGSYRFGNSVYQRLHWTNLSDLSAYWQGVQTQGGLWANHHWVNWSGLKFQGVAGSHLHQLTSTWQSVMKHHGMYVSGKWLPWNEALAKSALVSSFGLDSLHRIQLS